MRKLMMLLIFLFGSNIFAAVKNPDPTPEPVVDENIKPLRIGFFIGSSKESFCDGGGAAITYDFACAISQKNLALAIVSDYILKNLILRKYTKVTNLALAKNNKDFDHILEKIDFNLSDWDFYHVQGTQFFVLVSHGYDNPIFNKAKWTKLDIPSNPEYKGSEDESFPIIPWIKSTPSEAKRLLFDVNLKQIPYAKNLGSSIIYPTPANLQQKFEPIQLTWIFNPVEDYENLNLTQPCNIFMSGHGSYSITMPELVKIAGLSPEALTSTLLFFNDKMNTKSVRISTCEAGGKNLDLIRVRNDLNDLMDQTKKISIRIKYMLIIDSITDAPTTSDWKAEDATNVNLRGYFDELEKFQTGYKDFVDKLNTIKAKINALNSEIEQKMEAIEAAKKEMDIAENKTALENKIAKFMAEIEEIKSVEIEKLKSERKALDKSGGLKAVLSKISLPKNWYLRPLGLNSYPQVWIPEVGWYQTFIAVKINDKKIIRTITNPIFKDVEVVTKKGIIKTVKALDHLEFDLHKSMEITGWTLLLLYSEIVFVDLKIIPHAISWPSNYLPRWLVDIYRYFPSIPCVDSICKVLTTDKAVFYIYPQIISMQHGNSLNLFSKIILPKVGDPTPQNGMLNFLRDSFLILRGRSTLKSFFIKELQGFNDFSEILDKKDDFKKFLDSNKQKNKEITLQNVLITTSLMGIIKDETAITLSFEFMGKSWFLSYFTTNLNPKDPVPPTNKKQFLWIFKESKTGIHEENIKSRGLTYMANLSPSNYYAQLPTIRRLFKNQKTKSLQEFIIDLKPKEIIDAMKESPNITKAKWTEFEQPKNQSKLQKRLKDQTQLELKHEKQFRLQMNLNRLKTSLDMLKQKLELLGSKLEQLKKHLASTT